MSHTFLRKDDPAIESFQGMFLKVRRALGTNAFGLNEIRLPPGQEGLEHDESDTGHEEVYVVLGGGGAFTIAGEVVEVGEGDYLRVAPDATRQVKAGEEGLRFIAIGAQPKASFDGRETL